MVMKNPFVDQQIEQEVLDAPWKSAIKFKPEVIQFMKEPTGEQIAYAVNHGFPKSKYKKIPTSHLDENEKELLILLGVL